MPEYALNLQNILKVKFTRVIFLITILVSKNLSAQVEHPFSVYANGSYIITAFDVNTPLAGGGEIGFKFNPVDGLSFFAGLQAQAFLKLPDYTNMYVMRYNTQLVGAHAGVMYELKILEGLNVGPFARIEESFFRSHATFPNGAIGTSKNYNKPFLQSVIIFNYVIGLNIRKSIGGRWDIQTGASYNQLSIYYADQFAFDMKRNDRFYNIHLGLVYHFGVPTYNKARQGKGGKNQLGCPKF